MSRCFVTGKGQKAAFKIESGSWGAGFDAPGAGDMLSALPGISVELEKTELEDETLQGKGGSYGHEITGMKSLGSMPCKGGYGGALMSMLACVMGKDNNHNVSGNTYRHILELTHDYRCSGSYGASGSVNYNHFGSLYIDKQLHMAQYLSAKPHKVTITGTPDNNVLFNFDIVAHEVTINETVDSSAWTEVASLLQRIKWEHLVFQIATYSAAKASWGATDKAYISEFEVVLDPASDIAKLTTNHAPLIDEPIGGIRVVTFKFTVPDYGADRTYDKRDFLAEVHADTKMMAKLHFTGGVTGDAALTYEFAIYLPYITIQKGTPNPGDGGNASVTYECKVERPPANFTSVLFEKGIENSECVIKVQSKDSANYLGTRY